MRRTYVSGIPRSAKFEKCTSDKKIVPAAPAPRRAPRMAYYDVTASHRITGSASYHIRVNLVEHAIRRGGLSGEAIILGAGGGGDRRRRNKLSRPQIQARGFGSGNRKLQW